MATKQPSPHVLALLEKARAAQAAKLAQLAQAEAQVQAAPLAPEATSISATNSSITNQYGKLITYNDKQQLAIDTISSGKHAVLLGAAGTGKTTTTKGAINTLITNCKLPIIAVSDHRHIPNGSHGIVLTSFTRRAVQNLKRAMPEHLVSNCITIHKLLEYQPVYLEVTDPESGTTKNVMRFQATRHQYNPLPSTIKTIVIDEASMVSIELYRELLLACPHNPQIVLIGDIQQLPPVFGSAILGFKMLEWPVIELTEVYRQAQESPIIRLAHRILSGNPIPANQLEEWHYSNQLKLHAWKKSLSSEIALLTAAKFMTTAITTGDYDPISDVILIPFNKAFGTDEMNKHIANHIARANKEVTYEVIAGFNRLYFSVGDKVLYEREDAEIISISRNFSYLGAIPKDPSVTLDYWGHDSGGAALTNYDIMNDDMSEDDIDAYLAAISDDCADRVREASHVITVRMIDSGEEVSVSSAAEINNLLLAYALTVHKSQGSEWRKVFVLLHNSHNTMIQRELLYTACTRAKEELYVICEPDSFAKGIMSQRIKGNTLAEKAEFFKGKLDRNELQLLRDLTNA